MFLPQLELGYWINEDKRVRQNTEKVSDKLRGILDPEYDEATFAIMLAFRIGSMGAPYTLNN